MFVFFVATLKYSYLGGRIKLISSVNNIARILDCFSKENTEIGVTEIASLLDMKKSNVHHLIKTLQGESILVKTHNRKYKLGTKIINWGNLATNHFRKYYNAVPYMDELVRLTNETVHLAVREKYRVIYVSKIEPQQPIQIQTAVGSNSPIHCTGLGKVLMADSLEKEARNIHELKLKKYTKNTIIDMDIFINELNTVAAQGFAVDNEEFEAGLYCLAVPLKDYMGNTVAALSISGPEFRIHGEKENFYLENLKKAAEKISNYCEL